MTSSNIYVLTDVIAFVSNDSAAKQDLSGLTNAVVLHSADYSPTMVDGAPVD